jgi:hypothetical protein
MKVIRASAVMIMLGMLASASVGQESPQPAAPPPAPATPPTNTPPPATPPAAGAETPPAAPRSTASDEAFIPTQELQADEEATFPVDI